METTQSAAGRIRASDAEREKTAELIRAAMGEGRLDMAEGENRLTAVYAATYRDELLPLTGDLPGNGWSALAHTPEGRSASRRRLRGHAGGVMVISGILIAIWLLTGTGFFWPIFAIVPLMLSVFKHAAWVRRGADWPARDWHGHGPWGPGGHQGPRGQHHPSAYHGC